MGEGREERREVLYRNDIIIQRLLIELLIYFGVKYKRKILWLPPNTMENKNKFPPSKYLHKFKAIKTKRLDSPHYNNCPFHKPTTTILFYFNVITKCFNCIICMIIKYTLKQKFYKNFHKMS